MGADICVVQGRLLTVKLDRALEGKEVERSVDTLQGYELVWLFRLITAIVHKVHKQLLNMTKGRGRPAGVSYKLI